MCRPLKTQGISPRLGHVPSADNDSGRFCFRESGGRGWRAQPETPGLPSLGLSPVTLSQVLALTQNRSFVESNLDRLAFDDRLRLFLGKDQGVTGECSVEQ